MSGKSDIERTTPRSHNTYNPTISIVVRVMANKILDAPGRSCDVINDKKV